MDDGSDGRFAGLLGATLYGVSGAVVLATMALLPDEVDRVRLTVLATSAIVVGLVVPALPWPRHWRLLAALLAAVAQLHLAFAEWWAPGSIEHYLPLFVLTYLYVGMTQPPLSSFLLTPLTLVAFGAILANGTESVSDIVVTLPVGITAAEVVSRLLRRERHHLEEVAKVLDATKRLVAAESIDEAAGVIGELTEDLLVADSVIVLVVEADDPTRFTSRKQSDALEALGTISIDLRSETSGISAAIESGQTIVVPNAATSSIVSRRLVDAIGAGSVAFVPLFHSGTPVGAIVAVWRRAGMRLRGSAWQVIELVAAEAGPIVDRLRATERLNWEAETDPLTGVSNRRTFNRTLDQSRAGDALVMIDLDHFKRVNDERGHAVGDDVLRSMGAALRDAAREGDCVARFGGEEFAAILPGADAEGVRSFLRRLRGYWEGTNPLTTFSAGYAVRGTGEGTLFTLGRADRALYDAKAAGRNSDVEAAPTLSGRSA